MPSIRLFEIVHRRPVYLQIETLSACKAECSFYGYRLNERPRRSMELSLFARVLDDYDSQGVGALSLSPLAGAVCVKVPIAPPLFVTR